MSFKKVSWLMLIVLLLGLVTACGATSEVVEVEVTRVVTETQVQKVEVTRIVEGETVTEVKEVPVEVTRIVEVPAAESQVEAEPVAQAPKYTFYHLLWGMDDANVNFHIASAEAYMAMNKEVEIVTSGTETYDPALHAQLLDTIIASEPDGIFMHISDVDTLLPGLEKAKEMGIPVMSVTSHPPSEEPLDKLKGLVLPCWVGSDEALIGGAMGEYLLAQNPEPKHVIYLITTPGHAGHEARAQAFFDTMPAGTKTEKLATGQDPEQFKDILKAYLTKNEDVDVIFGMILANKWVADVLDDMGKKGEIVYFTSDEAPSSLDGIEQGYITATFTQEFPIQAQLAYNIMYLYKESGMAPVKPIITGPAIVDASNVEIVKGLVMGALGEDVYAESSPFSEY